MKSNFEDSINYLQFVDRTLDAEKQTGKFQNRPPQK